MANILNKTGVPPMIEVSFAELEERLKQWMLKHFGNPCDFALEPDQRDKWYRDYGLIHHFLRDQFNPEHFGWTLQPPKD